LTPASLGPLSDPLHYPLLLELMDCVDDLVLILDPELRIIMSNRRATAAFGYSEGELSEKKISSLIESGERRRMARFIQGADRRRGCEATFFTRSKKRICVHFSVSALGDEKRRGYLVVGRISCMKDLSQMADPSNGLAARILQGLAEPVFIVDGVSRIVRDCNEAAISALGFGRGELVGRRIFDYATAAEERSRLKALLIRADESYAKKGIFLERAFVPRKSGRSIPCDCLSLPFFKPDGSLSLKILILFDCTSEEEHKEAIADLVDRIKSLAVELEDAASNSSKSPKAKRLSELGFTKRQIEVARLVFQGFSSKEIGFQLGIAASTAKNHVALIFRKVGASSRISFVRIMTEKRIKIC
jgi:PAS domain S-box-containing protein